MMTGYSAVILVELLLLVITAEDAVTNRLITKEDRNRVILLSLLIGVAAVAEYIGVILNGASPSSIGLLNRRCYETNTRNIGSRAAILFFDVNKFKQVNDSYGHNVGDICLKNIAACLRASYGKFGTCYRIGGDEFCVILEDGLDKLDELNASFRNSIEKIRAEDHRMPNVALGYAFYDSAASHIQKVIEEADRKMYQNKRAMAEESAS
ncbi:MAG: GGDEF domain-containing protein [Lachnospiraceae bacterium]|nr:GGDEF domain-containing protein [Lachnospiraceae bacterium]